MRTGKEVERYGKGTLKLFCWLKFYCKMQNASPTSSQLPPIPSCLQIRLLVLSEPTLPALLPARAAASASLLVWWKLEEKRKSFSHTHSFRQSSSPSTQSQPSAVCVPLPCCVFSYFFWVRMTVTELERNLVGLDHYRTTYKQVFVNICLVLAD